MTRVKTQTGITATPNPRSVMWFDDPWVQVCPSAPHLLVSPSAMVDAYIHLELAAPIGVAVERISPTRELETASGQVSTAKATNKAHEDSGLTWEQLARVFGVSRRAVHMWVTGGRMNATNAELLMRFVDYLDQIPGGPDERRAFLLSIGTDGKSALDRLRLGYTAVGRRLDSLPRPESLLGVLHGDVAE